MITMYEWTGSILGLLGAFLLALNKPALARFGWLGFLLANFAMILFAISIERNGLLIQQCGFLFTSLLGFWRSQC
ncbi:hypothetical protein [Herbaspirillum sp. RV1423]|uniref:hypothetical protein n=1 Tax=Herbaspirillum sp. RV1423 TaxID=1443993 RepID=UPI0005531D05|nr:hypothetical protein [Herbaspirillum sp. RV1423]